MGCLGAGTVLQGLRAGKMSREVSHRGGGRLGCVTGTACGVGVAEGPAARCLAWGERGLPDAGLGSAARSDCSALSCFPFLK